MKYEQSCGSMIVLCSNGVSHVTLASLCSWMQALQAGLAKVSACVAPILYCLSIYFHHYPGNLDYFLPQYHLLGQEQCLNHVAVHACQLRRITKP